MDKPYCRKDSNDSERPNYDIRWGLAATAGAISYWHVDANGFGTYIDVQTGKKWWVIAREKRGEQSFASKNQYSTFDPQEINSNLWEVHAVMLSPGDRLEVMDGHFTHLLLIGVLVT
ncbi:hypothetical protein APHAL10511_003892 [Amanita phalloides]|nr:hypothetical protein APHAL10511_003892 [Amanita phalloides]